jgi:acetamidase/formamidase
MDLNVKAVFEVTRVFLPLLKNGALFSAFAVFDPHIAFL